PCAFDLQVDVTHFVLTGCHVRPIGEQFLARRCTPDTRPVHADDEEAIPLFNYLQQDATYFGVEAEVSMPFIENGDFAVIGEASAEYIDAELADGSPAPRIPPLGLSGALTVRTGPVDIRGEVEYFGEQDDVPAFESTTDSFTFVNASVAWRPFQGDTNVTLLAKVENIFDQEGRRASSFTRDYVPLPGRNFSLSARFSF
ncbi:TonB-dependent receptor, partial [Alteriqipengyuania sp.]|uniref:TonB-dependent receptor n=1 Tax=Alteriqipengyuania sp. TaxID=2800692 RepID=UPI0035116974